MLGWLDFTRHQVVLAVLALVFSFLGLLLVYRSGWLLVAIWNLGAILALFGLLHLIISRLVGGQLGPVQGSGAVFLLDVGVAFNVTLLLHVTSVL